MKKRGGGLQRDDGKNKRGSARLQIPTKGASKNVESFGVKIRRRREESRNGFTRVHVCIIRKMKSIIFVVRTASALFQFVLGRAKKDASSRTVHLSNGGEKV